MVWVVEYDDRANGDRTITVWDDKTAAYKDVCSCIIDDINQNGWDFSDNESASAAKDIEDHIAKQEYNLAVQRWNDWADTIDDGVYWSVHWEDLLLPAAAGTPGKIVWPKVADDDEEVPPTLQSGPFVATVAGATCRGPCKQWNEYAYADQADGTYHCYQCKAMSKIFGGTP